MNSLLIDAKSLTEWFQSINKKDDKTFTKEKIEEFEIRLKQLNRQLFDSISYRLSLSAKEIISISDETINYNEYRECTSITGEKLYQYKEKEIPYDTTFVTSINPYVVSPVRFSKSYEIKLSKRDFEKAISKLNVNPYVRNRVRTIYKYDDSNGYHIDCTVVTDSKNRVSYEIEIESNTVINDSISLFGFIKNSFHKCFPQLHTLFTPEKYKGLLKSIENRELPNIRQPVNIQSSHLDKMHDYYIGKEIINYSVTNKLDGVNYKLHTLKDKGFIILQNNTDLWLEKVNGIIPFDSICNTEVTSNGNIHVFDTLFIEWDQVGEINILQSDLNKRLEVAQKIVNYIKGPTITVKRFFNTGDVVKNIMHCMQYMTETYGLNVELPNFMELEESGVEYYNDGIIFQYNGALVGIKNIMPSLKWKFPSKITIDFLAKYYEKKNDSITYHLYSKWNRPKGIDKNAPDRFIPFKVNDQISSITFQLPEMCDGINCNDLNDKVLEVGWNRETNKYKLFRIRTDKTKERTNVLRVANETFPQMVNIFTLPKCIQMIETIRNEYLNKQSEFESVEEVNKEELQRLNNILFQSGQYPYKKLFKDEKHTLIDIKDAYKKLQQFNVFKENRIQYEFQFESSHKTTKIFYNSFPGIKITNLSSALKQRLFQYPTKDGSYLAIKTLSSDYENIDKITDYFIEDVRLKAVVKSEGISPYDYFIQNEEKIVQKVKERGLLLTNYNVREMCFQLVKEATLFKPTFCKGILEILSPNQNTKKCKWLDISAGWGDRLISAIASDVELYTAFDPNVDLKEGHSQIIEMFGKGDKKKFHIIYEPFETGIDTISKKQKYNLIFSSPPFFDFEDYSKGEKQSIHQYSNFDLWLHEFLFKSVNKAWDHLEYGGKMAIYIVDIGKYSIVEPLIQYVEKECIHSNYVGMIASLVKDKIPKPVWVWEKVEKLDIECEKGLEGLRKVHNDYKRELIKEYTKDKTVLDLGSGKGGDIHKYLISGAKFVTFVEPSEVNITECRKRLEVSKLKNKSEVFHSSAEDFRNDKKYDVICLFFMLTFFFESKEKCLALVNTIVTHLKEGGYCIGSTANGKKMYEYLSNGDIIEDCYTIRKVDFTTHDNFGKSILLDLKSTETATLQKEYLVYFETFVNLLAEHSIILQSFTEYKRKPELTESENNLTVFYGDFVFKRVKSEIKEQSYLPEGYHIDYEIKNSECIFNSIAKVLYPNASSNEEQSKTIQSNLLSLFDLEDYIMLDHGRVGKQILKYNIDKYDEKLKELAKSEISFNNKLNFNLSSIFDSIDASLVSNEEKEIIEGLVVLNYETFLSLLKDCINWDKSYIINYISKSIKCNIVVYNELLKSKMINGEINSDINNILNKDYPCMVLVINEKGEYYPVYKEVNSKKVYILSENELSF